MPTTLIGGARNVAGALLGPRDTVFGTAILGANYAADGGGESQTYSAARRSISAMAAICCSA